MTADAIKQVIASGEVHAPEPPRPLIENLTDTPDDFPVSALGDFMGNAAKAFQIKTKAPMAICAQATLAAVTVAVQGHVDIQLPTGQIKPVSQFLISIAASGERKSTCDALAMRPIKQYEARLREQYDVDYPGWKNEMDAWEKQRSQILSDKRTYPTQQTKANALKELGDPPAVPLTPLITCPEPTYEGMCKLLAGGQPSIGVFSDEGGQFIGGHGMSDDNKLRTATGLSSVWDGSPIKRVRAGDGVLILPGRRVSMHLMAQPDIAMLMLSDRMLIEQGLLSRFLVACPESTIGQRFWEECPPEVETTIQAYTQRILKILEQPLPTANGKLNELSPVPMVLSPKARASWITFADHIERQMAPGKSLEMIRGFANKLPEHAAKLSARSAYINDGGMHVVSPDDMAMGIELAQYYARQNLRFFSVGQADPKLRMAQKLLQWLHGPWKDPCISLPDVYQSGPYAVREKAKAKECIDILEEYGWLVPQPEGAVIGDNRRREAWRIIRKDGSPR